MKFMTNQRDNGDHLQDQEEQKVRADSDRDNDDDDDDESSDGFCCWLLLLHIYYISFLCSCC